MTVARAVGSVRWSLPAGVLHHLDSRVVPGREYIVYVPTSGAVGAPVFVTVHGISRNVLEHAQMFSGYCETFGVVLVAPHFALASAADYQRLGRDGRGPRADLALDGILEEAGLLTGADTTRIHLFGFSGGAQFAHRYTMAHPQRVVAAVIASAGWYTFPDPRQRYPYGIRSSRELPDLHFDPDEFLQVPFTVVVGDQDITEEDLRCTGRVNRQQGETRLDRARNWVQAMRAAAELYRVPPLVTLQTIPGGDHSFPGLMQHSRLGDRTFEALFGAPPAPADGGDRG